jgi:hypothetical protein
MQLCEMINKKGSARMQRHKNSWRRTPISRRAQKQRPIDGKREPAARAAAAACHCRLRPGILVPAATNKENLHGSELSIQDERIWKDER